MQTQSLKQANWVSKSTKSDKADKSANGSPLAAAISGAIASGEAMDDSLKKVKLNWYRIGRSKLVAFLEGSLEGLMKKGHRK